MRNITSATISSLIERRCQRLKQILEEKQSSVRKELTGTLRISVDKGRVQYYQRSKKETNGKYIPQKDIQLAIALAQMDYDRKVFRTAQEELVRLQQIQADCTGVCPEDIYLSLSSERQALITPIELSDDEYIRQWEAVTYEHKEFRDDMPEFYTEKGERVRSKSEILIANLLKQMDIPYRYECPLKLERFGTIHPDFTVLHVRQRRTLYLEHLGMLDELGYAGNAVERINGYIRSGIYPGDQLFLTFETSRQPLNIKMLQLQFERYFI
ncbi:MAG: hypothetical protein IIY46_02820 [Lachnospiraceae bacterium]|nr:hypothetical protein [Lachnospiraceae bacterium]